MNRRIPRGGGDKRYHTAMRVYRRDDKVGNEWDHCSGGACAATQPAEEVAGKRVHDGISDCSVKQSPDIYTGCVGERIALTDNKSHPVAAQAPPLQGCQTVSYNHVDLQA